MLWGMNRLGYPIEPETLDLRAEITRIVRKELRAVTQDRWVDAAGAADHLRMSRHHFLRLCRKGCGPEGRGASTRLKRWKISMLDDWQSRQGAH